MAMNFFEHQDSARRRTRLLVTYLAISVVLITISVYAVVFGMRTVIYEKARHKSGPPPVFFDPFWFSIVTGGTLAMVGIGTAYKMTALNSGAALARMLGGRPINANSKEFGNKRLLNVVEEMSIASGLPVPTVYVLEKEKSINTFAAGFSPSTSVIAVTAGARDFLTREELQGVIAHEFGHILNGDVKLNIRLIGILHGILLLGLIGYALLRSLGHGGRKDGRAVAVIAVTGLTLLIVGYIGVFFGRIIKSAVSREREYLADATAVDLTRNPDGIANALKKLGGSRRGGRLLVANAEEASHMYFGSGLGLTGIFATHPTIPDRIRRIHPQWDGKLPAFVTPPKPIWQAEDPNHDPHADTEGDGFGFGEGRGDDDDVRLRPMLVAGAMMGGVGGMRVAKHPGFARTPGGSQRVLPIKNVIENIGAPQREHLQFAQRLMQSLTDDLRDAAHEPAHAPALVFALLLDDADESVRGRQIAAIATAHGHELGAITARLADTIFTLDPLVRLPLIDLSMPALREMPVENFSGFMQTVDALIKADGKLSLTEFAIGRLLRRHLHGHFFPKRPPATKYITLGPLAGHISRLISAVARTGHVSADDASAAFGQAMANFNFGPEYSTIDTREDSSLSAVREALDNLALSSPGIKRRVIEALAVCVCADGQVTVREAELLRAICDSLDCPMPPLFVTAATAAPAAP